MFAHPINPEKKKELKKEDGSVTTRDLKEEEYKIEMEMYFYKYKNHLLAMLDW